VQRRFRWRPDGGACAALARGATRSARADDVDQQYFASGQWPADHRAPQDIVLGLYYVSLMRDGDTGQGMAFADMGEIEHALQAKAVTLHTRIKGRAWTFDGEGQRVQKIFETTPGRMILGQLLPHHVKIPFDVVNKLMTKKEISNMIDIVYRNCGQKETVIFCDRIMALGFREAFKAGISFGKDDMVVPET